MEASDESQLDQLAAECEPLLMQACQADAKSPEPKQVEAIFARLPEHLRLSFPLHLPASICCMILSAIAALHQHLLLIAVQAWLALPLLPV